MCRNCEVNGRTGRAVGAVLFLLAAGGCEVGREFRQSALPGVHTGVSAILNGLVDGVFAAIEVDPQDAGDSTGGG